MGRMRELVDILNKASKAYYAEDTEIMSNFEYDKLYDELVQLEKETGITLSDSPTIHVGYEVVSSLPKEKHPAPMLSLDKTKEVDTLRDWLGSQPGLLSWKMDGLTIVLTVENLSKLLQEETEKSVRLLQRMRKPLRISLSGLLIRDALLSEERLL